MSAYLHRSAASRRLTFFVLHLPALLCLLACAGRGARADIKLSLDVKEGDKISDVAVITAKADSADNIDKVEFYVDDQLKFTATSVPYEFKWDTIPASEGPHTLAATAFDGNGQMKKVSLSITIDNTLGMGGAALGNKALDALNAKNYATARNYARRALKADPGNPEGSRVLAGLYAADSDWGRAIATLEKSSSLDTSTGAMLDLARYKMRRALMPENAATLFTDLDSISDLRRKAADLGVAEVTKAHPGMDTAGHEAIGDALMNAGRYHDAASEYALSASGDNAPLSSINRLALANIVNGDLTAATDNLHPVFRDKKEDAASRAVLGLLYLNLQRFTDARTVVAADAAAGFPAALVVSAYADAASLRPTAGLAAAEKAVALLPNAAESHYALSMTLPKLTDQEEELDKALSIAPLQLAMYLDFAARAAVQKQTDRTEKAERYVDFVLKRDPNNAHARLTKALIEMQTNRLAESGALLDDLSRHFKNSADVMAAVASYFAMKHDPTATDRYMEIARKLDPEHFSLTGVPSPNELLFLTDRRYHYRAGFFLTPSSLDPRKQPAVEPTADKAADAK